MPRCCKKQKTAAPSFFVSLPFHFLLLQEMCFARSLSVLRLNMDGIKSKSHPRIQENRGGLATRFRQSFTLARWFFDRVRLARNCVACVLASIRGETNARGHQGRFRCLYTLMRGPTNKPFAAAVHESSFLRLGVGFVSLALPVPTSAARPHKAVKFGLIVSLHHRDTKGNALDSANRGLVGCWASP